MGESRYERIGKSGPGIGVRGVEFADHRADGRIFGEGQRPGCIQVGGGGISGLGQLHGFVCQKGPPVNADFVQLAFEVVGRMSGFAEPMLGPGGFFGQTGA